MKMSVLSKGLEGGMGGMASAATNRKNWEGGAGDVFGNMAKDGLLGFGKSAFGGLMGSLPSTLANKDSAKEHPGMMWMQKFRALAIRRPTTKTSAWASRSQRAEGRRRQSGEKLRDGHRDGHAGGRQHLEWRQLP